MRGPKDARGVIAERVLVAARQSFATVGFDRTSLRGIARDADVDPALVRYYFGTKEELFRSAVEAPPGYLDAVSAVEAAPRHARGAAIAHEVFDAWEDATRSLVWRTLFRSAASEETALARLEELFAGILVDSLPEGAGDDERRIRLGMAVADIVGLTVSRYLWRIPPVADTTVAELEAALGATLEHHLTGPLASSAVEQDRRLDHHGSAVRAALVDAGLEGAPPDGPFLDGPSPDGTAHDGAPRDGAVAAD